MGERVARFLVYGVVRSEFISNVLPPTHFYLNASRSAARRACRADVCLRADARGPHAAGGPAAFARTGGCRGGRGRVRGDRGRAEASHAPARARRRTESRRGRG